MKYIPELDGIRGIAVTLVVFSHYHGLFNIHHGALGVDIFFVLSGFLITRILVSEIDHSGTIGFLNFYARRALRLAPALLTMVACTSIFYLAYGTPVAVIAKMAGTSTLYLANWVAAFDWWHLGALSHTWSLAVEEQFYLVWPVMLICASKILGPRRLPWFTLALAAAVFLHRWTMLDGGVAPHRVANGLDTRSDGILIGSALGAFTALQQPKGRLLSYAAVASLYYLFFILVYEPTWYGREPTWYYRFGITSTALAVACVIANTSTGIDDFTNRILRYNLLRLIGKYSYGIYLWHYPIYYIFWMSFDEKSMRRTLPQTIDLFILVPVTLLICWASYRWIEKPALRLKSRFEFHVGTGKPISARSADSNAKACRTNM